MPDDAPPQGKHVFVECEVEGCRLRVARKNLEYEEVDTCLFEQDYTIAGSTGFLLWPGTWVTLELLRGRLGQQVHGRRVVELGSGIGLAGLAAAAAGAHVIMTDLPSIVSGILETNVVSNSSGSRVGDALESGGGMPSTSGPWPGSRAVGLQGGSVVACPLNWEDNLEPQLDRAASKGLLLGTADMVLACDVVWLKELLTPFTETTLALLRQCRPGTPCLLTFLDRGKGGTSASFSSTPQVAAMFTDRGCSVNNYHSEQIDVDGERLDASVMEIVWQRQPVNAQSEDSTR